MIVLSLLLSINHPFSMIVSLVTIETSLRFASLGVDLISREGRNIISFWYTNTKIQVLTYKNAMIQNTIIKNFFISKKLNKSYLIRDFLLQKYSSAMIIPPKITQSETQMNSIELPCTGNNIYEIPRLSNSIDHRSTSQELIR